MGVVKTCRRINLVWGVIFIPHVVAADNLIKRITDCRSILQKDERLTCYDAYIDSLASPKSIEDTQTKNNSEHHFGWTQSQLSNQSSSMGAEKMLDKIVARVTRISALPNGALKLWLSNDQVWVQVVAIKDDWIAVDQVVTIKAGALSSYNLKTEHGSVYKVHRAE